MDGLTQWRSSFAQEFVNEIGSMMELQLLYVPDETFDLHTEMML